MQRQLSRSRHSEPEADTNFTADGAHDGMLGDSSPRWCAPSSQVTGRHSLDNSDAARDSDMYLPARDSDMYLPEASFRDGVAPLLGSGSNMPNGHSS